MKIAVVDRTGNHLSLGRSFLHYAILGIPFFLNGAMFPPSVVASAAGYLIGFLFFGIGGATIYLYVFNRRTRQSLHDLAVGSFVIKKTLNGKPDGSVWRPHLVAVAVWCVAAIGIIAFATGLSKNELYQELRLAQSAVYSSGMVHAVTVQAGTNWSTVDGNRTAVTYFHANPIWKGKPDDYETAAEQVASAILRNCPDISEKDVFLVTIAHGYDIGISRTWITKRIQHSPSEWQELSTGSREH